MIHRSKRLDDDYDPDDFRIESVGAIQQLTEGAPAPFSIHPRQPIGFRVPPGGYPDRAEEIRRERRRARRAARQSSSAGNVQRRKPTTEN